MNKTASIYGIKNVIDNKIYIGSSINYKRRKHQHFYELKNKIHSNEYLQRAYDKYGKEKFHMFLIEECDISERVQREVFFIEKNKSYDKNFGYNIYQPNGDGFQCSEETIKKMVYAKINNNKNIEIDCYFINLIFYKSYLSINECAKDLKIKSSGIIFDIINQKNNRLSYKGYTFFRKGEKPYIRKSSKQRDMTKFRK